jgi:hypothetical protein
MLLLKRSLSSRCKATDNRCTASGFPAAPSIFLGDREFWPRWLEIGFCLTR